MATTVTRHRRDDRNGALALSLEAFGSQRHERHHRCAIGGDFSQGVIDFGLRLGLIGQGAMGDQDGVKPTQGADGLVKQGGVVG